MFCRGYVKPDPYTGDAKLTQLNATVTDTYFELVYRCQKCWTWSQDGVEGSQLPTGSVQVVGWAQNSKRYDPTDIVQHDKSQGIFGISVDLARNAKYSDWVKLPAVGGGGATPTSAIGFKFL